MRISKKIIYTIPLMISITAFNSCYYDVQQQLYPSPKSTNCDTSNVTYTSKVLPVIQSNCYSCHSGSAPSGNVNLEGYANLRTYANNGKLMGTITNASGFSPMPQGGTKLSDCSIAAIQVWINNGSINN